MPPIGTLNEKPLHASLKDWYSQPGDRFEVQLDSFFIDIVRGDRLIEIQTAGFSSIKRKLAVLLEHHQVHLVHPIPKEKWIIKLDPDTEIEQARRKSPRRGRLEDVFLELIRIPHLIDHPNFSIEVLLTREEEVRRFHGGRRNWRRKGWGIEERRLIEVIHSEPIRGLADLRSYLPDKGTFTSSDVSDHLDIKMHLAQKICYVGRKSGLIIQTGKVGRLYQYEAV